MQWFQSAKHLGHSHMGLEALGIYFEQIPDVAIAGHQCL